MDEKFRKQMEKNGADVVTTLKRFMGNETIYMKFLMKFPEDKNYDAIMENIRKNDYDAVFNSAHTLKGVSANLGLKPVYNASSQITELLRNRSEQQIDVDRLNEYTLQLQEAYGCFREILDTYKSYKSAEMN